MSSLSNTWVTRRSLVPVNLYLLFTKFWTCLLISTANLVWLGTLDCTYYITLALDFPRTSKPRTASDSLEQPRRVRQDMPIPVPVHCAAIRRFMLVVAWFFNDTTFSARVLQKKWQTSLLKLSSFARQCNKVFCEKNSLQAAVDYSRSRTTFHSDIQKQQTSWNTLSTLVSHFTVHGTHNGSTLSRA